MAQATYKSPGALVKAVRFAREHPHARFNVPGRFPIDAAEVLSNFASGLMKRCNRGLTMGNNQRYLDLMHDARVINDAANRIRWPGRTLLRDRKMIKRYPHLHNPPMFD